jgi:hypothetical protein
MSASEIIKELPKLSEGERRAVQQKLLELAGSKSELDLRARGIDERQAADLRGRLGTFAEDWNRPEMDAYDAD